MVEAEGCHQKVETRKATKTIALVLISSVAVFFGFKSCYDANDGSYSTTQPSGHGAHGGYYHGSRGAGGSSSGSHFSGTGRGGFGGSGHSVGS